MRPILRIVGAVTPCLLLVGASGACSSDPGTGVRGDQATVTASFYPLADLAERIGGDCVVVTNLTPPGVEPHDLELTPDSVEAIASADLVLYLGEGFQPAVQDAIGDAEGRTLDLLSIVHTVAPPVTEAAEGLTVDPHVWLDPALFATAVPAVVGALQDADPNATCDFEAAGQAERRRLERLDHGFTEGLADCDRTVIVTNHAAFGYLAAAYGLTQQAISGLQPDAEPTPERLAQLRDLVEREGVTTIFTEDLVPPQTAQTLADEAGVQTAVLHTIEGLTPDEVAAGQDYRSLMESNLETLRSALGCS
jgi:zinc transport system substrate-binding protein